MFDWQVHSFLSILQRTQLILQMSRTHAKITRKFSSLLLISYTHFCRDQSTRVKSPTKKPFKPRVWACLKTKLLHNVQTPSGTSDVLVFPMSITSCYPTLPSTDIPPWLSPNSHTKQMPKIDHTLDDPKQLPLAQHKRVSQWKITFTHLKFIWNRSAIPKHECYPSLTLGN